MIRLKTVRNIFELTGRKCRHIEYNPRQPISSYIPQEFLSLGQGIRIAWNQRPVGLDRIDGIVPQDNDEIMVVVIPQGAVGGFLLQAVIIPYVIGRVVGALMGDPAKSSAPAYSTSKEFSDSVSYGWDGIRNTVNNGQPIPVVYGQHKVGGQVVQLFSRTPSSNKNKLYMLIALAEGCIQDISGLTGEQNNLTGGSIPSGIKINGNAASQYNGVYVSTRIGANNQSVISDYRNVTTNVYQGVTLTYGVAIQRTTTGEIEAYDINLNFPSGLYKVEDDGGYASKSVIFSVRHKKSGGAWSTPVTFTVSNKTRSEVNYTYRKDDLELGIYDIEITRTTANDGASTVSISVWESHNEITYDDLTYPNVALLAVRALATDQLSGGTPTVTCIVKGKLVWVWNGDTPPTFTQAWSDNPAWCLMDLLTNSRYGLGQYVNVGDLDLQSFKDFADYCDVHVDDGAGGIHHRCTLNMVFDGTMSAWDAVNLICATARSSLIKSGKKIRVKIEKAESPVQLFTMGNIIKDSLKIKYVSIRDRANFLEVQFLNQNNDYEQDIISIDDPDAFSAGEDLRKETVSLYGITRPAQAYREGLFQMRVNRHLKRMIEFEAGVDAIACEPGDVINFQHDLPEWGEGGRVVSATDGGVVLDRPVTIGGRTYRVRVRLSDDTQEEKTVSNGPGTYTSLSIVGSWTTIPSENDVYSFGVVSVLVKPFRITEITRAGDLTRKITAIEYNALIYDDNFGELEDIIYTQLPDPQKLPDDITNLELSERVMVLNDGTLKNVIDINFTMPSQNEVSYADVYWREDGTDYWEYAGSSKDGYHVIQDNVSYGITYEVAVVNVSIYGTKKDPDDAPSDTIGIQGKTDRPSNVTGLTGSRIGDVLYLEWTAITEKDFLCYEVRVGGEWNSSVVLGEGVSENRFQTANFSPGLQTFMVKAKNTSGLYSLTPALYIMDVGDRINQNVVIERDEKALGWPGVKTDMTVDGDGNLLLDEGELTGQYEMPVIDVGNILTSRVYIDYLGTQVGPTPAWEDATFTWESAEAIAMTWAGPAGDVMASSEISFRTSLDNITWTDWREFVVGEYQFQYLQIRVDVTTSDIDYLFKIEKMNTMVDVPDVFDSDEDVVLVAGANDISFAKTFVTIPAIGISIQDGAQGDYYGIINKASTGFRITVYDSAGVPKISTVDWVCRGY